MSVPTKSENERRVEEIINIITSQGGTVITNPIRPMYPIDIKCDKGHKFSKKASGLKNKEWCPDCLDSNIVDKVIKFIKEVCNDEPLRDAKIEDQTFTLLINGDPKVGIDCISDVTKIKSYLDKKDVVVERLKMRYVLLIDNGNVDVISYLNQMVDSESLFITNYVDNNKDTKTDNKSNDVSSPIVYVNTNARTGIGTNNQNVVLHSNGDRRDTKIDVKPDIKSNDLSTQSSSNPSKKKIIINIKSSKDVTPGTVSQAQALLEAYSEEESKRKDKESESEFEKEYNQRVEVKAVRLYQRVSTEEQAKNGHSLSDQNKRLEDFAVIHGYPIADKYIDKGVSGKDIVGRPEMVRLLKDIQPFEQILCTDLTRLARNMGDFSQIRKEVYDKRATIRIITMEYDISHPNVKPLINFQASMAESERDIIALRTKTVMNTMAKDGRLRAYAKYGFRYNEKNELIVVVDEMKTIDYIRFLVTREPGITRTEICNRLNSSSKHKPRSAKKWYHTQVTRIMDYYGIPYKRPNNEMAILPDVIQQSKNAVTIALNNDPSKK